MIYRTAKFIAAIFSVSAAAIMISVSVIGYALPEKIHAESIEKIKLPGFEKAVTLSFASDDAKAVFLQEDSSEKLTAELFGTFPIKEIEVSVTDRKILTVCGTPFGVKMFTDGVLAVGFSRIDTESGSLCPALDSGIREGDLIKSIDGKDVFRNEDVAEIIENSNGKSLVVKLLRDGETLELILEPQMLRDESGYKAGIWVRDSSAGIGTLTYYDPETLEFGGLGHAVCDVDTGKLLPFSSGEIVPAAITGIRKGEAGAPGELSGAFIGKNDMGTVLENNEAGLYGKLEYSADGVEMPIAHKQEITEGEALILSTVDGTEPEEYEIIIESINLSENSPTRNIVIRITDEELLSLTGGIVQGMSGSPIIQDGKLVGAVTHVLVNDPTQGYGIFIENMLDAAG